MKHLILLLLLMIVGCQTAPKNSQEQKPKCEKVLWSSKARNKALGGMRAPPMKVDCDPAEETSK